MRASSRVIAAETIHPRKGTETPGAFPSRTTKAKQFIPARGRKPLSAAFAFIVGKETIHPRKGTETRYLSAYCINILKQFIPARGRKRLSVSPISCILRKQFIPARGRKPSDCLLSFRLSRNNSSPQGDGNAFTANIGVVVGKQFIPARGRKRGGHPANPAPAPGNNSSPQGDGNAFLFRSFTLSSLETIHPRKGTETHVSSLSTQ